jgi:glycosyltransferase involved in cell wall biosynthesis
VDQAVITPNKAAPAISVLMSCYNGGRWLGEAINSILVQTFGDFEFIVVDDGSTDDSLNIIKSFAERDSRIIVIAKPNTGLADSLNVGIAQANGMWIARLDVDDVALRQRFEKQLNYVRSFPDIVLAGSGCVIIDHESRELKTNKYPSSTRPLIRQMIMGGSQFPHSTAFYRAEAVRRLGGYRPRIYRAEDKDLWLRMSTIGEIGCLPEPLIKLRKHSESITAKEDKCAISSYAAMLSFMLVQAGKPDPVEQDEKIYRSFLLWLENQMIQDGYFERNRVWSALRELLSDSPRVSLFTRIMRLSKGLLCSPHGVNILRQKLFGSDLAIRLANEWIKTCDS